MPLYRTRMRVSVKESIALLDNTVSHPVILTEATDPNPLIIFHFATEELAGAFAEVLEAGVLTCDAITANKILPE